MLGLQVVELGQRMKSLGHTVRDKEKCMVDTIAITTFLQVIFSGFIIFVTERARTKI